MDFSLFLFLSLVVTGVVWAWDAFMMKGGREQRAADLRNAGGTVDAVERIRREPIMAEYARSFFPVILFVFVLRSFLFEPFRIPSGSMLPNLLVGDFIVVNKYAYGVRLPVINKKVINIAAPDRGDVMVFRFPRDPSVNYIKRVIGVPGDRIAYRDNRLHVNGKAVTYDKQADYIYRDISGGERKFLQYLEQLDGESGEHRVILEEGSYASGPIELTVPEGQYFVMGDNRDNSNDSRYWGFVPDANVVGKAFMIWFSWDLRMSWDHVLWHRMGNSIN
ncbi:MAG: signal peptidase I [Gammaproteobacteria bacterium]|nr:signal peptidase I [Gammaproteobacteria bacterium]